MKKYSIKEIKSYALKIPRDMLWENFMTEAFAKKYSNKWDSMMPPKSASPLAWFIAILNKFEKEPATE